MEDEVKVFIKLGDKEVDAADVEVPDTRTFRDAWKLDGEVIDVDMTKAVEIAKNKIRAARTPHFDQLDAEFMKALESGGDTKGVAAKKQTLRDATKDIRIVKATQPEDLEIAMNEIIEEFEEE